MKKLVALTLFAAMLTVAGRPAFAEPKDVPKDIATWWGNTGATPDPYKDTRKDYPGYWWYPNQPEAEKKEDIKLYGNRGVIYAMWAKPAAKPAAVIPQPVAPPATPSPAAKRSLPIAASFLFDFDKSVIKPEGKVVLDTIVLKDLQDHPKDTLLIEGHTCDIGTDAYNMGLGQRRADSAKRYLVEKGIDSARISTKSYGESKPAVPNTNAANRKLNRRVMLDFQINGD